MLSSSLVITHAVEVNKNKPLFPISRNQPNQWSSLPPSMSHLHLSHLIHHHLLIILRRYPRSTRGVPPKRYSPEKIGKKSRHGVTNFVQGNLTKMARAFEAALYEEEEIPQTAEEAMRHEH
ncbi:uncharacterized protein LOC121760150 [Salvia splendens]|uniref:uncharacterized protein LOC121760150 n=1 Tax=Salvia splendens TaxID=180675 RepID=UPI001C25FCAB|nr:uncharacterized protein LOC121760150 [Salvia splendens]